MRPLDQPQDQGDTEIDEKRAPADRQDRRQGHPQRQMREGLDDFDQPLDQDVGPAAVIPRDAADQHRQREADGDPQQSDGQRDPRPVDDPRQHVPAEPVGAEQKQLSAARRAEKVHVAAQQAPEAIAVAMAEKPDRFPLFRVRRVDPLEPIHVEPVIVALDIGPYEPTVVEDMNGLRRRVNEIDIARIDPVRGEELAEQDRARQHGKAVAAQLPPHHAPLRGGIETLLRWGQPLGRVGIERPGRDIMGQRLRGVRRHRIFHRRAAGGPDPAHRRRPACNRIRGSSAASARSEISTPITVMNARNIRNEPARYMSWLRSASSIIGPVVGRAITTETITVPEMTCGSNEPISEMNGFRAMRSGYLNSTLTGERPLARAVMTYCFCSSSSRLARSLRIIAAVPPSPMTMTGTQRWASTDAALAQLHGRSR